MPSETGFERKTMRQCIENWLYADIVTATYAESELRKRFEKAFPEPEWAKSFREQEEQRIGEETV